MTLAETPVVRLDGQATTLGEIAPGVVLLVNVASKCGFTPQYAGLEALWQRYGDQGLTVVGMPCNQFLRQEPGTAEEIGEFCQLNYGVTFPLLAKGNVNGSAAEPVFAAAKAAKDGAGLAGPVLWNFEKFLIGRDGSLRRFRSATEPEDPAVTDAIEAALRA
ncbi:glutathione peroxidase [Leucobacter sp. M11]|uniref:glutathione peroxidase n=1 Tax=Leucobacter sp. M11 TaxID=2993565 RepID=UPI002D7EB163|nr:glutathione peroxidase [Leucobacter sp. M11]MEB4613426.1 glutathione peroxidase [Leucobacter sp. M11]